MRTQISGKQIDIGDALSTHVRTQIVETFEKYAQDPTDAVVTFSRDAYKFLCDVVVHLSTGLTVQARGTASEIYAAFDACREKMDKQLRRYKRRLKDHYRLRTEPMEFSLADSYVLSGDEEAWEAESEAGLQPLIVAEMETSVPTISVGDAVMHMELSGTRLQVFRNEKHGGVNVVYLRDDGNVGWIDPRGGK